MSTYARWVETVAAFRAGDDRSLETMVALDVEWQSGVAQRLSTQVHRALSARLERLSARLQRDFDADPGVVQAEVALARARSGLAPLARFASMPSLPDQLRAHLRGELTRVIADLQRSLDDSVQRDTPTGVELDAILRRTRLTDALAAHLSPPDGPRDASRHTPVAGSGRRILR